MPNAKNPERPLLDRGWSPFWGRSGDTRLSLREFPAQANRLFKQRWLLLLQQTVIEYLLCRGKGVRCLGGGKVNRQGKSQVPLQGPCA